MTSISKNVYIDKLDDIVNECNNTYHRTIKIKPIDVKDNTYIKIGKEVNENHPKGYTPSCSEEIFVIKEIINDMKCY